jgi:hypothetical protein
MLRLEPTRTEERRRHDGFQKGVCQIEQQGYGDDCGRWEGSEACRYCLAKDRERANDSGSLSLL